MANWDHIITRLAAASVTVDAALTEAKMARRDERDHTALPAQPPTEDQIVAALKADPAMAGRVVAEFGMASMHNDRMQFAEGAKCRVQSRMGSAVPTGLQSLAVALAAASYRG